MTHYDLAIIGTGSGNSLIDESYESKRVAILEHGTFGGTCLNVGCIPTKMFVYPADLAHSPAEALRLGVDLRLEAVHWPTIRDRIFGRIDPIAEGGEQYRRGQDHVTVYSGTARFTGERTIDTGTGETITADQVVIAAGSRPRMPGLPGLDEVEHHTSDTIMRLEELPRRMVVVGGGYIAAELSHVFSAYGVSVVQVARGARLLTSQDAEIGAVFTRAAQARWDVRLNTKATAVSGEGKTIKVELDDGSTLETDCLLMATGRVPNSDRLDLEAAGVKTDDAGVVVVDEHQRTSAVGVWALGDVANHHQLKHVANHEARVVAHNLLHPDDLQTSDHRFVPAAVFTDPQIASVGLTEAQARSQGLEVAVKVQKYADVAFGWAMEDTEHLCKLVGDRSTGRVIGAHLVGPQASILIHSLIQGMSSGQTALEMVNAGYWIHPALTEVVENALLGLFADD